MAGNTPFEECIIVPATTYIRQRIVACDASGAPAQESRTPWFFTLITGRRRYVYTIYNPPAGMTLVGGYSFASEAIAYQLISDHQQGIDGESGGSHAGSLDVEVTVHEPFISGYHNDR